MTTKKPERFQSYMHIRCLMISFNAKSNHLYYTTTDTDIHTFNDGNDLKKKCMQQQNSAHQTVLRYEAL